MVGQHFAPGGNEEDCGGDGPEIPDANLHCCHHDVWIVFCFVKCCSHWPSLGSIYSLTLCLRPGHSGFPSASPGIAQQASTTLYPVVLVQTWCHPCIRGYIQLELQILLLLYGLSNSKCEHLLFPPPLPSPPPPPHPHSPSLPIHHCVLKYKHSSCFRALTPAYLRMARTQTTSISNV